MLGSQLFSGALAGCIATAPMTAAMEGMYRLLPRQEQYPLPPSEITAELTEQAGVRDDLNTDQHVGLTLVNHFAYGTAAGALYAPLAKYLPIPPAVKGIAFGLLVWTVSYLGWLPAMGIMRPATEHPQGRNVLMILAHVVWGLVTGVLTSRLARERSR
jgi:uncharacterized membrane protein YagU involved in acid resistance